MASCDEIKFLLGPFDDGELEPNEMEEVALHVVGCKDCKAVLDSYRTLGVAMRDAVVVPGLDGFAQRVVERVDQLHTPFTVRVGRFMDRLSQRMVAAIAIAAATGAVAVLTAVLVGPFARQWVIGRQPSPETKLAARGAPQPPTQVASASSQPRSNFTNAETSALQNSRVIISRLEADSPSVAVWNEPKTDTTVIWVPDQQP